ncbi:MAG: peptidoglycan DD-metalloendopeptidase family protein [Myxacorys californica WJT36-NPBG1]|jgi:murein DD-endopeptidase MepM/ murein hydrolase activator NlpD|nr:peptidoglycan DD-metalloendopeptidase family protein [Myxacorys californica WJT36-NPBG1]
MLELVPSILALQSVQDAQLANDKSVEEIAVTQQKAPLPQANPKVDPTPAIAIPESISVPSISVSPIPIQTPVIISTPAPRAISATPSRTLLNSQAAAPNPIAKAPNPSQAADPKPVLKAQATSLSRSQTVKSVSSSKGMVSTKVATKASTPSSTPKRISSTKDVIVSTQTVLPVSVEPVILKTQSATEIQSKNEVKQRIAIEKPLNKSTAERATSATPDVGQQNLGQQIDQKNLDQPKHLQEQSAQRLANPAVVQQQKLLEQRLAEIVVKDKAAKQAKRQEALIARAYQFAAQQKFEQARKTLQDPEIASEVRSQVLETISSMQARSPLSKPTQVAKAPIIVNPPQAKLPQAKSPQAKPRVVQTVAQAPVITQIPVAVREVDRVPIIIQSRNLPQSPVKSKQSLFRNEPKTPQLTPPNSQASRFDKFVGSSDGDYAVVNPSSTNSSSTNLAYNPNLPKSGQISDPTGEVVYPLPAPVPVTSSYGWRTHPITRVKRFHSGIDLGAAQGTPILATRQGKVAIADRLGGYGLAIVVEHQNGKQDTMYAHLSEIFVSPGQKVEPGAVIGRVGSTGVSTGPHLHYEARQRNGSTWVTVDPSPQLESAKVRLMRANS